MRFLYASDIHTEFPRTVVPDLPDPSTYDTLILAGDLGLEVSGLRYLCSLAPEDKTILFVPGNHEYYHQPTIDGANKAFEQVMKDDPRVHALLPGSVILDDVLIVGATLWTDLQLQGYHVGKPQYNVDMMIDRNISDFRVIRTQLGTRFSPTDCRALYRQHRDYLERAALARKAGQKLLIITHFVPTQQAIHAKFLRPVPDPFNPYFTNDCDDLMEKLKPDAWVFGHTHMAYEGTHPSGTRLHCNPMGYPGELPATVRGWRTFEL